MNAIQAFNIDRAKCVITADDFALPTEWYLVGTQLRATLRLRGVDYLVEVETGVSGGDVDHAATSVGVFDSRSRYLEEADEMVHVYGLLRDAAAEEVERRAVEIVEAHEEERESQAAENVMFEEAGMR